MAKKMLSLTYESSLTEMKEANSSFDTAVLRIAYAGNNRNGSNISKEAFEKSIKSIYNCPIVCNYNREEDSLGGHDVEVVKYDDGSVRLINSTTPVGCVPESARVFWEEVEDDNGNKKEYLCADALLWKRQEAYRKIKEDGITSQSMEITVLDGEKQNGVMNINEFEFTAFTLIGVEPCFENAALEFNNHEFEAQFSQMMAEIKTLVYQAFSSSPEAENEDNKNATEGGTTELDEVIKQDTKEPETEEIATEVVEEPANEEISKDNESGACEEPKDEENFSLNSNFYKELNDAVCKEKIERPWGLDCQYYLTDYDYENKMVYFMDASNWTLFGAGFSVDGDEVSIDFKCKKRMKYEIVEYACGKKEDEEDDCEKRSCFENIFGEYDKALSEFSNTKNELENAREEIAKLKASNEELQKFKAETEMAADVAAKEAVLDNFSDLCGAEEFELLRESFAKYSVDELEEKCFVIRGKRVVFSAEEAKAPKIKVDKSNKSEDEPYGGIFAKYGIGI